MTTDDVFDYIQNGEWNPAQFENWFIDLCNESFSEGEHEGYACGYDVGFDDGFAEANSQSGAVG